MNAFPDLFLQDLSGPRTPAVHPPSSSLPKSSFFNDQDGRKSIRSFGSSGHEHEGSLGSPGSSSAAHLHVLSSMYGADIKPWSLVAAIGMQDIVGCDRAQDTATCLRVLAPYMTPVPPGKSGRGRELQESTLDGRAQKAAYNAIKKYTMGKVKSKSKGKKDPAKWHEDVGAKLDILESQFLEPEYLELFALVRRRYELPAGHLAKASLARFSIDTFASPGDLGMHFPNSPTSPSAQSEAPSSIASQYGQHGSDSSHEAQSGVVSQAGLQPVSLTKGPMIVVPASPPVPSIPLTLNIGDTIRLPRSNPVRHDIPFGNFSPPPSANLAGVGAMPQNVDNPAVGRQDARSPPNKSATSPPPASQASVAKALQLLQQAGLVSFDADASTMAAAIALVSSRQEDQSKSTGGYVVVSDETAARSSRPSSPAGRARHRRPDMPSPPRAPLPLIPLLVEEEDEASLRGNEWARHRALWLKQQAELDQAASGNRQFPPASPNRERSPSHGSSQTYHSTMHLLPLAARSNTLPIGRSHGPAGPARQPPTESLYALHIQPPVDPAAPPSPILSTPTFEYSSEESGHSPSRRIKADQEEYGASEILNAFVNEWHPPPDARLRAQQMRHAYGRRTVKEKDAPEDVSGVDRDSPVLDEAEVAVRPPRRGR